jgi:phospholipid/cholesterol/gamma-HCH transport system permease protein
MDTQAFIKLDPAIPRLIFSGTWNIENLAKINRELKQVPRLKKGDIVIDGQAMTKMDSAGAWLFIHYLKEITAQGLEAQLQNFSEQIQQLLAMVNKQVAAVSKAPCVKPQGSLLRLGRLTVRQWVELRNFLSFTGELAIEFTRLVFRPTHWRWNALVDAIDKTGFQALPIIALLSFMIGVVIAYQMGNQLRNYGANVFIVNLLGLSVLREFGPLITAIMVAGRTGSAFTAQLGMMKINQEIDALNTMGVTPAQLLLLPRIIGLFVALPLLTMWADVFGVMGGMLMAHTMLGLTWYDFLQRFQHEIPLRALIIGLGKAPVFALLIGSIGCFQGMQVQGSADSVGKQTTRSVVLAIFFIVVADAMFSIIFSKLKL